MLRVVVPDTLYSVQWRGRDDIVRGGSLVLVTLAVVTLSIVPGRFVVWGPLSVDLAAGLTLPAALVLGSVGAWGAAIGHLVVDVTRGVAGPSSVFGALGQLLFGLVGYRLWHRVGTTLGDVTSRRDIGTFVFIALVGAMLASSIVGLGDVVLGDAPFFVATVLWFPSLVVSTVVVGCPVLFLWSRLGTSRQSTDREHGPDRPPTQFRSLAFASVGWFLGVTALSLGFYVFLLVPDPAVRSLGLGKLLVLDSELSTTIQITVSAVLFVWLLVSYVRRP